MHWQRRRRVHACALPPAAPSAHGKRHTMLSAPCRTRCAGTEGPEAPRQPRKPRGNPSSVVNIYTPDNSSHPTHQQATRRGETPGWRKATCVCLPARAPQRAGGPGAWSRGKVTRRGRGLTRPMEKPIHRWKRPSLMEEPLTNRRDADIDKRGAVKRRRVHTQAQYARNASKTLETSKSPRTQRRSESDATSPLRLPGSGSLQT